MLTRRALLKGAALTAGALIRVDDSPFQVVAQAVSPATVRVLFLPSGPGSRRQSDLDEVSAARLANDGALTRPRWPPLSIGRTSAGGANHLEVEVTRDLGVRVSSGTRVVQELRVDPGSATL